MKLFVLSLLLGSIVATTPSMPLPASRRLLKTDEEKQAKQAKKDEKKVKKQVKKAVKKAKKQATSLEKEDMKDCQNHCVLGFPESRTLVLSNFFQVTDEFILKDQVDGNDTNPGTLGVNEDPELTAQVYADISVAHMEPIEEVYRKMDAHLENYLPDGVPDGLGLITTTEARLGTETSLVYDSSGQYDISSISSIYRPRFDPSTGLYAIVFANAYIGLDNNAIPGSGSFGSKTFQVGGDGSTTPVGKGYFERFDGYPGEFRYNEFTNFPTEELSTSTYITGTNYYTYGPEHVGDDRPKMPSSF